MAENRITEGGVFGPVFASGVCPAGPLVTVTEGIAEFRLVHNDVSLTIVMTVPAADLLADYLADAVAKELKAP